MERVSKSQAVKLKEAGYDVPCEAYYISGHESLTIQPDAENNNDAINAYSAPYLDEMIDWLDTKGICLCAEVGWTLNPLTIEWDEEWLYTIYTRRDSGPTSIKSGLPSRTSAKSAGIDKALELLTTKSNI